MKLFGRTFAKVNPSAQSNTPNGSRRLIKEVLGPSSDYYNVFLNFKQPTKTAHKEYLEFKRSDYDYKIIIIALVLVMVIVLTRGNLVGMIYGDGSNPFYILGFSSCMLGTIVGLMFVLSLFVMNSYKYNITSLQKYYKRVIYYCNYKSGRYLEDSIIICVSLSVNFYMLARVMSGQCDLDLSVMDTQHCNPMAGDRLMWN